MAMEEPSSLDCDSTDPDPPLALYETVYFFSSLQTAVNEMSPIEPFSIETVFCTSFDPSAFHPWNTYPAFVGTGRVNVSDSIVYSVMPEPSGKDPPSSPYFIEYFTGLHFA